MVRIRTHANPFQVPEPPAIQWCGPAPPAAPVALEIGCGRGDFLLGLARAHPEAAVLGLEIRRALVEHVQARADRLGLQNIATALADATRHLGLLLPGSSVAAAFVLFPDPWRKKKHHKRRLLHAPFLTSLTPLMRPGGTLDVQTDHEEIAAEADREARAAGWVNLLGAGELEGRVIPDCNSRRCRMHRERGAPIFKMRFGRPDSRSPPPGTCDADPWLGHDPIPPVVPQVADPDRCGHP